MVESQTWNLSLDALLKELRVTSGGLAQEEASRASPNSAPTMRWHAGAAHCGDRLSIALPIH